MAAETTAEGANASPQGGEDQNRSVANESAADSTEVGQISTAAPAAEDKQPENADAVDTQAASDPESLANDYASLSGDAANGERVFTKCLACHATAAGQNKLGPSLYDIVGKPAGSVMNFKYSPVMKDSGVIWDDEALHGYLKDPKGFLPGNRMMFPGVASAQDRADLIAYLKITTE